MLDTLSLIGYISLIGNLRNEDGPMMYIFLSMKKVHRRERPRKGRKFRIEERKMSEDIKKLVDAFTDQAMTGEGRASVLAYARGRLDAQKELARQKSELPLTDAGKNRTKGINEGDKGCKS
jgi:hypothetical protein